MQPLLSINNISCRYHDQVVVQAFNLQVEKGSIACLLGPSGCGKTTVLRAIAGFAPIASGTITLRDKVVSRPGYSLAPEKRKLGLVFQEYALFPHLNLEKNVLFGLRNHSKQQKQQRVQEMLALVGMADLGQRFPHELSGGQQQRIALARALAPQPDLILFDEPFSNLDVDLRERLGIEVQGILKQQGVTGILVTHDQHEAFAICDQIAVMREGRILQWDNAYQLYHQPADRFVADFIGQGSFLKGTVLSVDSVETEAGIVCGTFTRTLSKGERVDVLFRPDDIVPDPQAKLLGEVVQKAFKGAEILYTLRLATGGTLLSLFPSHQNHEIGDRLGIRISAEHLVAFPLQAENTACITPANP